MGTRRDVYLGQNWGGVGAYARLALIKSYGLLSCHCSCHWSVMTLVPLQKFHIDCTFSNGVLFSHMKMAFQLHRQGPISLSCLSTQICLPQQNVAYQKRVGSKKSHLTCSICDWCPASCCLAEIVWAIFSALAALWNWALVSSEARFILHGKAIVK